MEKMLKGKVAIITGASYGMGHTMEVVKGIRQKGGKAGGVLADVCATVDTMRVL